MGNKMEPSKNIVPAKKAKRKQAKSPKKPTKNKQSVKNTKRIDAPNTHGWQVHFHRDGSSITKMFSDGIYKGKSEALTAAKKYRDDLLKNRAKHDRP